MRDIAITLLVLGLLPVILRRPEIGVLAWTWLSLMSPHRLTWGFAFEMPFAQIVGLTLLLSLLMWKEPKRLPWTPVTIFWGLFVVWMFVTTAFSLVPDEALNGLEKSVKIQLFAFVVLVVMTTEQRLKWFVWVVTFSIAFFGIKGGVFTISRGGEYLVWGPQGSFIAGNNELALALIVVLPLMRFLQMHAQRQWLRWLLGAFMLLCVASVIGSHSRGAFLALGACGFFLVWKSRRRAMMVVMLIIMLPIGLAAVPQKYWDRMNTIKTYEEDSSAMGRINAWTFAWNVAKDRPLVGGGFNTFAPHLFYVYAPDPEDFHDVHSIYFEVLGEHGFVGLFLWLGMAIAAYLTASRTARRARGDPDCQWQADLALMCQVSLIGYATGGAFLGLAYFDLYYNIVGIVVLNHLLLVRRLAQPAAATTSPAKPRPRVQRRAVSGVR